MKDIEHQKEAEEETNKLAVEDIAASPTPPTASIGDPNIVSQVSEKSQEAVQEAFESEAHAHFTEVTNE